MRRHLVPPRAFAIPWRPAGISLQRLGVTRGDDDHIVELLHYPDDADRLAALRGRPVPRLLVVTPPHLPPPSVDPLEDWVWGTASGDDVEARVAALQARHQATQAAPTLDGAGRLCCAGATVRLSPTERALAGRLLADFGAVVGRDALTRVAWPRGWVGARTLDTQMMRLRRHVVVVGLAVRTVRARGWLLERLAGAETPIAAPRPA